MKNTSVPNFLLHNHKPLSYFPDLRQLSQPNLKIMQFKSKANYSLENEESNNNINQLIYKIDHQNGKKDNENFDKLYTLPELLKNWDKLKEKNSITKYFTSIQNNKESFVKENGFEEFSNSKKNRKNYLKHSKKYNNNSINREIINCNSFETKSPIIPFKHNNLFRSKIELKKKKILFPLKGSHENIYKNNSGKLIKKYTQEKSQKTKNYSNLIFKMNQTSTKVKEFDINKELNNRLIIIKSISPKNFLYEKGIEKIENFYPSFYKEYIKRSSNFK